MGQFIPPSINLFPPPLLPAGLQSHPLHHHRQAKSHIHEPQLRCPLDPQLRALSPGLQPRQTAGPDPSQVLHRLLLHDRRRLALRSLPPGHGEDLQEGLLLRHGDGNAAGDGGGGNDIGDHRDGIGRWALGDEDGEPEGVRQGTGHVLGDGGLQRGDVAAVLHGDRRDGVLDVLADRRDLHDGSHGNERVGRCCGLWGRVWGCQGSVYSALFVGFLFLCVWDVHQDEERER